MQQQNGNGREPVSAQRDSRDIAVSWGGRVDFAQRLTRLFEQTSRPDGRRWTLQHVADECVARGQQVTKQYVLHLKSGVRSEPRLNLVEALADVFGVPVAYFTADYAGRITADLLPVLLAMTDPRARALLTRDDIGDVLAALADHRVQAVIHTVITEPATPAEQPR